MTQEILFAVVAVFCIWLIFRIARVAIRLLVFLAGLGALLGLFYFLFVR